MKKSYPIRRLEVIEIRSPNGVKRIEVYKKFAEVIEEIDDESVQKSSGIDDFITHDIYEGIGHILVEMGGQAMPQPFKFKIKGAKNIQDAIDKFDSSAEEAVEEMKDEREKMSNQIVTADSMSIPDLNDDSNILIP